MIISLLLKHKAAIASIAVVLSIIGFWKISMDSAKTEGYNLAVTEIRIESAKRIEEATAEAFVTADTEIKKAIANQRKIFDAELEIVKSTTVVNTVVEEVINEVEKIVYVDNCGKLNIGSVRLLNKTVDSINSTKEN